LTRLLEARPAGQPITLVSAMINVAITGLYVSTIADGLRLEAWQEPQLAALQTQLKGINLSPLLAAAFRFERASVCRTLESTRPAQLFALFAMDARTPTLWDKIKNPTFYFLTLAPRGWVYQNMVTAALSKQKLIDAFDPTNFLFVPHQADAAGAAIGEALGTPSPYNCLAVINVPNFTAAMQATARNQTLADEAFLVCALERHRLAHRQYPDTLDALVPEFADKLPADIISRRPLRYRRTNDGQFVLYSVGWNEQDDGGSVIFTEKGKVDVKKGDWVWGQPSQ
jgi:hypothetical protein